jgi:hypothetical protein
MSVNRISQSHANEARAVQNVNSQKSQNAATKANAVDGANNSRIQTAPAAEAKSPASADNNTGHEQARQQNSGEATNVNQLNLYA